MKSKIFVAYSVFAVASWFLISGWEFASIRGDYPESQHIRQDAGFSSLHGAFLALVWPIGVPIAYCISGFAEHGWHPVWDLRPEGRTK